MPTNTQSDRKGQIIPKIADKGGGRDDKIKMARPRQSSEGNDGSSTLENTTSPGSDEPSEHGHYDTKHQHHFSGLADQKQAAEQREEEKRGISQPEDRSFAYRKPGAENLLKEFFGK